MTESSKTKAKSQIVICIIIVYFQMKWYIACPAVASFQCIDSQPLSSTHFLSITPLGSQVVYCHLGVTVVFAEQAHSIFLVIP